VAGRSSTLLKVKTFHDAEALVVGHQDGAGRHKGRLGALLVRLPDGTDFAIGTGFSDRERSNPPAIGTTVTFRYQELSDAGVPRFPSYIGVRPDAVVPQPQTVAHLVKQPVSLEPPHSAQPKSPIAVGAVASGNSRYFEFVEGASNKFWEVSQAGNTMTTRWGRIGSAGQSKAKAFADPQAAAKTIAALIEEKLEEGYVERPR
jgi:DNA ligase-1